MLAALDRRLKGEMILYDSDSTTTASESQEGITAKSKKRYWWFKMKKTYLESKEIKVLRRMPDGYVYFFLYIKLQLASLENDGILHYDGYLDSFAEEIAVLLDEDIELVDGMLSALFRLNLIEKVCENTFRLVDVQNNVGSESASAPRVRNHRLNKTQRNADVR